ncbi:MAG: flagellin lysine-N-methylase [Clostridia bacterium]|nr:flagellin lysine-N-methylase [Clostridia bacterium]
MKQIAPDYYAAFRCIAGECKHNCCIGWEIDVDDDTLCFYRSLKGELGDRLRQNICMEGDAPHFVLGEGERCPFLNEQNLCDIIIAQGEGALCCICSDHPRFYNELSDRTEAGVGLCCEAAGELILSRKEPVQLLCQGESDVSPDEEEAALLQLRETLFALTQDRTLSIEARMEKILDTCSISLPALSWAEWAALYESLERLDPMWDGNLNDLKNGQPAALDKAWDTVSEQLLHYFLYRHLAGALYDGFLAERAAFAVLSVKMIRALLGRMENPSLADAVEISRRYSAEIEYSDENIDALLNALSQM